jgi:glycine C-acetyltransferase
MYKEMKEDLANELIKIEKAGLYKHERIITTPQGAYIKVSTGEDVLNFCANNYLGLANHPRVIEAAHAAIDKYGYGMSSVRFICGTQDVHKELEKKTSEFLGTEDTILYAACFDANGGVFEPLLAMDSAIITASLNHASIIDGIRLTKTNRFIYKHNDMNDLEAKLIETKDFKYRLIATDGVFSMDGEIADLKSICSLADKYNALVMVDDSHASGFVGKTGRGTAEHNGVLGKVDIITTTFGKALGGASGGCVSGKKEIIEMLRQRSRPYLFSNTLAPVVAATSLAVLNMLSTTTELRDKLETSTAYFRKEMVKAGFDIKEGVHPIVPIMLYNEPLALQFAEKLLAKGIYVIGFCHPVVPKGEARIRVQISAAHEQEHLDKAIRAFSEIGKELGVIKN